jgi:hypothetical protein
VNYRPEYSHQWGNKTYYTQLRLDPLVKANQCGEKLRGVAHPFTKLPRASVSALHLRRGPALNGT